jgi:hypothetical protein
LPRLAKAQRQFETAVPRRREKHSHARISTDRRLPVSFDAASDARL